MGKSLRNSKQIFTSLINRIERYLMGREKWAILIVIAIFITYFELQDSHDEDKPYFLIHVKIVRVSESTTTFRFDLINIGADPASNFTMKSILIADSPRNAPILVDSFTADNQFPYNIGPHIELKCKCLASKFYLVSIIRGIDSELNESFTQEYIAKSINNKFTHHMDREEKKELEDNVKRILPLDSSEDEDED